MDIQKEREAFEEHITNAGLVEFSGYRFEVDECDEYLHEPTQVAWDSWLIGLRRSKAQAVPEGFVLVLRDQVTNFWQDADEPENFVINESDFDCLGDCIDLGEIIEINKHAQAHIKTEKLYGTWFADALFPSEKANFHVGTQEECNEIIAKNKAMIEAQEQGRE